VWIKYHGLCNDTMDQEIVALERTNGSARTCALGSLETLEC